MKNLSKSKTIVVILLTMIMCMSLFLFSACSAEDDKVLFKIVYRPFVDSKSELFGGTYKKKIKESLDYTTDFLVSSIVGAFGIGEIEVDYEDIITGKYEKIKLSPELPEEDEYYYSSLLGIDKTNNYYNDTVANLVQTTNIYYYKDNTNKIPTIMVLSNNQVTEQKLNENIAYYDEASGCYKGVSSLLKVGTRNTYEEELSLGEIYFYEDINGFSYVFIGGYAGASYNTTKDASNFVTKLLSTNYNNIQQTVGKVEIYNGSDTGIYNSASWEYSLTEKEMENVYDAQDYLETYKKKFIDVYKVEFVKAILTRNKEEEELPDNLDRLYYQTTRRDITNEQKKKNQDEFIDACCEYIDHLGIIPDDIESITKFLLETAMGSTIEATETIKNSCSNFLKKAQETYKYVPLLEVYSYKGSELDSIKIDGYIQSIIILREDDSFKFEDMDTLFDLEKGQTMDPMLITIRHNEKEELTEYPIAVNQKDLKDGEVYTNAEKLVDGQRYLQISKSENPIKTGLFSKTTSIVDEPKDYANLFTFSTSTENTEGFCWCFNSPKSNFIEITFGSTSLFQNQHLNIDVVIF